MGGLQAVVLSLAAALGEATTCFPDYPYVDCARKVGVCHFCILDGATTGTGGQCTDISTPCSSLVSKPKEHSATVYPTPAGAPRTNAYCSTSDLSTVGGGDGGKSDEGEVKNGGAQAYGKHEVICKGTVCQASTVGSTTTLLQGCLPIPSKYSSSPARNASTYGPISAPNCNPYTTAAGDVALGCIVNGACIATPAPTPPASTPAPASTTVASTTAGPATCARSDTVSDGLPSQLNTSGVVRVTFNSFTCPDSAPYPMHSAYEDGILQEVGADFIYDCQNYTIHFWCCTLNCACHDPVASGNSAGSVAIESQGAQGSQGSSSSDSAVAVSAGAAVAGLVVVGGLAVVVSQRMADRQATQQQHMLQEVMETDPNYPAL